MEEDHPDREFTPSQRMMVCNLKQIGKKYPSICRHFRNKYKRVAPSRQGMNKMMKKVNTKFTTMTMRKGKCGRKVTARTVQNIESVKRSLERASARRPGHPGPSCRRHDESISKSSYNRITKYDLKLKPFKFRRIHKVTPVL